MCGLPSSRAYTDAVHLDHSGCVINDDESATAVRTNHARKIKMGCARHDRSVHRTRTHSRDNNDRDNHANNHSYLRPIALRDGPVRHRASLHPTVCI